MNEPLAPSSSAVDEPVGLRLALRFANGEGRLVAAPLTADGVQVAQLILTLPHLSFPCDVSGGVDSFRNAPSRLLTVTLGLDAQALTHLVRHGDLYRFELGALRVQPEEGWLLLQGSLLGAPGQAAVPFTLRVGVVALGDRQIALTFFGLHLYGPATVAPWQIPQRLRQALAPLVPEVPLTALGANAWSFDPERLCAHVLLPHHGFAVPEPREGGACAVTVGLLGAQLRVEDAETLGQKPRQLCGPVAAAWAAHQHFAAAEQALIKEPSEAAARHFADASFTPHELPGDHDGQLRAWAKERCFALALMRPALFEKPLAWEQATGTPALRLLDAARLSGQGDAEAAALAYESIAGEPLSDLDRALALLAAARERRALGEPAHLETAVAHLRKALALAPLPPYAQAWLCELLQQQQDNSAALTAARAWVLALEAEDHLDLAALCQASCTAARLCMDCGQQFEEARSHLEQLLARVPNHGPALWQLVRVHGAACQIPEAERALQVLISQTASERGAKGASQCVALGDLAREALGDRTWACELYRRALERAPDCAQAHLRLGHEARRCQDNAAMVAHLQAVLDADAKGSDVGGAVTDVELADVHLALGSYHMATPNPGAGPRDLFLGLKHLRQAVALDPDRDDVRLRLEDALRAAQDWSALAELLVSTGAQAAARGDLERARRWQLQAARLHLGERNEPHKALGPLLALVRRCPSDEEALSLLVPLLESSNDTATLRQVLTDASTQANLSAVHRGLWLHALWRLEVRLGSDARQQLPILAALLQIFPQNEAAARAQVALLEGATDVPAAAVPAHDAALAEAYLTLADASIDRYDRAHALGKAARTFSYVGDPKRALAALEASRQQAPLDIDNALLGAQLKHDVEGVAAAREWLEQAMGADGNVLKQPFAYRLYDRLAELAAFAQDVTGEIEALLNTLKHGGTSYSVCVRLLSALEKAERHKERAQWLMTWAQAGWPLEIAPSYQRAAAIYQMLGEYEGAREAYRAMGQLDAPAIQQAGAALTALGEAQGNAADVVEGLTLQHKAALKRQDKDGAARLREARVLAHDEAGDPQAAVALCRQMLADDPRARLAHAYLAQTLCAERAWASALDHGLQATLWGSGEPLSGEREQAAWSLSFGLALDLRPELKEDMQKACPKAFRVVAYSERLMAQGDYQTAEHLLQSMLESTSCSYRAATVRLQLAALYTGALGDIDRAEQLLRENLAQDTTDVASRRALLPVYSARGASAQEAELHLALSNLTPSFQEALEHTLASARLYAQDPKERSTAEQIVMAFARRSDVPKVCPELWQGLKSMGMTSQLQAILATGLEEQPSADDGRLATLVHLLAQDARKPERAIDWCQRMQQQFPQSDVPWHLHIELLVADGQSMSPGQLLEAERLYNAWAQLRQGEAQASILDALAQHLRGAGEATRALRALEAALDVSDAGPERARERLLVLFERYLARADLHRAEQTLERLLHILPPGADYDAQLRRLAELCEHQMQAPERALAALARLGSLTDQDARSVASLAQRLERGDVLAQHPEACAHVPLASLWPLAEQLTHKRSLAGARCLLQDLLQRLLEEPHCEGVPPVTAVWALIDDVWRDAGHLRTLCAWRLQWAAEAPEPQRSQAVLLALTALHGQADAGTQDDLLTPEDEERLAAGLSREFAEAAVRAAPHDDVDSLGLAFALTAALGLSEERLGAATRWLSILPEGDSRRADPLLVCCQAALTAGDAALALDYAQQLEGLADAMGEEMMLRALAAQPDRGPYLGRLLARVELAKGDAAPAHLLALAQEQLVQGQYSRAQATLERVGPLARDFAWGELAVALYGQLGLHQAQAEAAGLTAHLAGTSLERARYMRLEAAVRWWELGQIDAAHALLHRAQAQCPLRYQDLDDTLGGSDVQAAKRRLHEALVVMPKALAPTLLRRLAALLPHGAQRDDALKQALASAGDDTHELGLLAEAARAASCHEVLQGALTRLAELAVVQEPRRAARLWLEASHGLKEAEAAPLWVHAATALYTVGQWEEAGGLVRRALDAGHHSLALSTLVWRHLPESTPARLAAARMLARHNQAHPDEAVSIEDPLELHLCAGEAALLDDNPGEAVNDAAWVLASNVDAAGAAIDVPRAQAALILYERALEAQGNLPALVDLWRRGCGILMPADPWAVSRRRRAAYLSVAMVPVEVAQEVWQGLSEAEPNLREAQIQHWGLLAPQTSPSAQVKGISEDLQPLSFGPHRLELTLAAATLLGRRYPGTKTAIAFLGAQLHLAMAAWQGQKQAGITGELSRSPVWRFVAAIGDHLAERLGAAGSDTDKLAVLAHCARLAPPAESLPRLAHAGLLAQGAGDEALAYTLWYPVAVAPVHDGVTDAQTAAAQTFCYKVAAQKRDHNTVIDLLTRMAQRAEPKQAAGYFAEAATWAEEGALGQDQALRLLQASHALQPSPEVACRLMQGLLGRGDVAALLAAHFIFVNAELSDAETERLGLALIAALKGGRSRADEREAAIHRLFAIIDKRLPSLPAVAGYRLQRARADGEPHALLDALDAYLAQEPHSSEDGQNRALHEEAASLAQQLGQFSRAWDHWQVALDGEAPSALLMWRAWEGALAHEADSASTDEPAHPARRWLLGRIGSQAAHLKNQATHKGVSYDARVASLRLLTELAYDDGDGSGLAWAQQELWLLVRDSGTQPGQRLAQQVSATLREVLAERHAWAPLAQHLQEAAERCEIAADRGMLHWQRGDVLRRHLRQARAAKKAYEAALHELPEPLELRLAAAQMALAVGEPRAALAYAGLSAQEAAPDSSRERLQLLLQAMVAADDLSACEPIVAELIQRDPADLFALHAGAVHASRAADAARTPAAQKRAEMAWGALAAALGAKSAPGSENFCRRGDALEQVAHYARAQGEPDRACQALRAAIQEDPAPAVRARRLTALSAACLLAGHNEEAALVCQARAEAAEDPAMALEGWLSAADIWLTHCRDTAASLRALWQASSIAPDRADIWLNILDRLPADATQEERLMVADRLLLLQPKELRDPARLSALACAYAPKDAHRALALFGQAEAQGGVTFEARPIWEDVAWQCDDMQTFVPLAKAFDAADTAAQHQPDADSRRSRQLVRRARLAEAQLLRPGGDRKEGLRFLRAAMALLPHPSTADDVPVMRHVASICATEPDYKDIALKLYAIVLEHTPLDVEALRIAARLAGQVDAIDRAYGLYACLLWLFPMDQEAKAFVEACRAQGAAHDGVTSRGPWVKRVQQALEELAAQGAIDPSLSAAKPFDVAQLLRRDIEAVLNNMLPSPPTQITRGRALTSSAEAMALFRFAQSPQYVRLRHKLGAQLPTASN